MNRLLSASMLFALLSVQSLAVPAKAGDAAVDQAKANNQANKAAVAEAKAQKAAAHGHGIKATIEAKKAQRAAAKAAKDQHKANHDSH